MKYQKGCRYQLGTSLRQAEEELASGVEYKRISVRRLNSEPSVGQLETEWDLGNNSPSRTDQ